MNELEKGYIHIDDNGNMQYVSYDTVGGGMLMIALLVLATVFITDISTYITSNRWIVIIPTLIAVLIRTVIFDKGLPIYKRLLNILSDAIKTVCIYGVLIVVLNKYVSRKRVIRTCLKQRNFGTFRLVVFTRHKALFHPPHQNLLKILSVSGRRILRVRIFGLARQKRSKYFVYLRVF